MSKYNKGDKFEVEVKDVLSSCADGRTRYLIKGFSSLIFDDCGLDRLKQVKTEETEVDWSKVEVDTPILVKNSKSGGWYKKYFSEYKDECVYAWDGGGTSWSSVTHTPWEYAKLAEVGE